MAAQTRQRRVMINNIPTASSSTTSSSRPSSQTRNEITKKDTGDTNSWYRFSQDTPESDSKSPKEREKERELFLESLSLAGASPDSCNFYPQNNFYLRGVCSRVPGPLEYETAAAGGEQPDPPQTNSFAALAATPTTLNPPPPPPPPPTQINSQLLLRRVPIRPHSSATAYAGKDETYAGRDETSASICAGKEETKAYAQLAQTHTHA